MEKSYEVINVIETVNGKIDTITSFVVDVTGIKDNSTIEWNQKVSPFVRKAEALFLKLAMENSDKTENEIIDETDDFAFAFGDVSEYSVILHWS